MENESGALSRVSGLFSARGYNIESLAVAEIDQTKNISRITIVTTGTPQVIDQIKLQLKKLVPVHKVGNFKREDKNVIFKEMALFKVVGNSTKIKKQTLNNMKAMILAAGEGKRLQPLTLKIPKPLIKVGSSSLIEDQINRLLNLGINDFVINI